MSQIRIARKRNLRVAFNIYRGFIERELLNQRHILKTRRLNDSGLLINSVISTVRHCRCKRAIVSYTN